METLNILSKASAAVNKDMLTLLGSIMERYDIVYKGTEKRVSMQELQMLLPRNCVAVSNTGNKCKAKCFNGSEYCMKHYKKGFLSKIHVVQEEIKSQHDIKPSQLTEVFLDDTFYLVDAQFIYDRSTLGKVGYVDDGQYILTDDPFILNLSDV